MPNPTPKDLLEASETQRQDSVWSPGSRILISPPKASAVG